MSLRTLVVAGLAFAWWRRANWMRTRERAAADQEARLDEALDESFPASDPPSITPAPAYRPPRHDQR